MDFDKLWDTLSNFGLGVGIVLLIVAILFLVSIASVMLPALLKAGGSIVITVVAIIVILLVIYFIGFIAKKILKKF